MHCLTFQYMSDVHTEYMTVDALKKINIVPVAPYLILAGDIGDPHTPEYEYFLKHMANIFTHVFVITGNHEYWQNSDTMSDSSSHQWIKYIDAKIKSLTERLPNVTFLQNNTYHIPNTNITIFGGTFWSNVLVEEEEHVSKMNDYKYIPNFTIDEVRKMHTNACVSLHDALCLFADRDFIVISHHMPSYSLVHPRYLTHGPLSVPSVNSAYASEITLANNPRILAWVAGHTHTPIQKGKFYLNPIGYQNENNNVNYTRTFSIRYDPISDIV